MIAILGGLATAVFWSMAIFSSTAAARRIGARSTLAGQVLIGFAIAVPAVLLSGPVSLTTEQLVLLAVIGIGNVVGLLFTYSAVRAGKVSVVGPIVSTEGALAGLIAVVAGESLATGAALALAIIAIGVVLAASERDRRNDVSDASALRVAALALGGALSFALSLYATGRIGAALPIPWAILPARLAGVLIIALPMALRGGLGVTREALPFVVVVAIAEIAGVASFAVGARDGIAVTAVVASQFAAISAVAAIFLFKERLARHQIVGIALIAVGVAVLTAVRS